MWAIQEAFCLALTEYFEKSGLKTLQPNTFGVRLSIKNPIWSHYPYIYQITEMWNWGGRTFRDHHNDYRIVVVGRIAKRTWVPDCKISYNTQGSPALKMPGMLEKSSQWSEPCSIFAPKQAFQVVEPQGQRDHTSVGSSNRLTDLCIHFL